MFFIRYFFVIQVLDLATYVAVSALSSEGVSVYQRDWEERYEAWDTLVGKRCMLKSSRGTCRIFDYCKTVAGGVKEGKPIELECGVENHMNIVCCPNSERDIFKPNTTWPTGTRPAHQMCLKYTREEPALRKTGVPISYVKGGMDRSCYTLVEFGIMGVGGKPAFTREFPHMAAIGYPSNGNISWQCGGTLISEDFVLTAAHCLTSIQGLPKWVRLGELNFKITTDDAMPLTWGIAKMIKHPKYKRMHRYHDIALLKLDSSVTFSAYARPACLSLVPSYPDDYRIVTVATGWGLTQEDDDEGSAELMAVTLPLVPHANCSSRYAAYHTVLPNGVDDETQLCAGGEKNIDTCQGDSGGPLVIRNMNAKCMYDVIGITSFGSGCGYAVPGIYTRVYNYVPWIESIVWPNLN